MGGVAPGASRSRRRRDRDRTYENTGREAHGPVGQPLPGPEPHRGGPDRRESRPALPDADWRRANVVPQSSGLREAQTRERAALRDGRCVPPLRAPTLRLVPATNRAGLPADKAGFERPSWPAREAFGGGRDERDREVDHN